eukprot:TRINITY_DN48741_c0_g1_i1.p3 TRINITY_DN48741_c0_g1~~TRINITY_DN48741_c0_g1_i1.p3  ORF type:complete len:122 (-),score=31.99 TRINITY_DN48741_c0_g1_i1:531-896(-)
MFYNFFMFPRHCFIFFFLNALTTTEIYTILFVGSVRCVQETGINAEYMGGTASLDLAYSVIEEFGLKLKDAKSIAKSVANATKNWANDAARLGAGKDEIEMMRSAFDHDDLKQGLKGYCRD